jgi:hypothetical protein
MPRKLGAPYHHVAIVSILTWLALWIIQVGKPEYATFNGQNFRVGLHVHIASPFLHNEAAPTSLPKPADRGMRMLAKGS